MPEEGTWQSKAGARGQRLFRAYLSQTLPSVKILETKLLWALLKSKKQNSWGCKTGVTKVSGGISGGVLLQTPVGWTSAGTGTGDLTVSLSPINTWPITVV